MTSSTSSDIKKGLELVTFTYRDLSLSFQHSPSGLNDRSGGGFKSLGGSNPDPFGRFLSRLNLFNQKNGINSGSKFNLMYRMVFFFTWVNTETRESDATDAVPVPWRSWFQKSWTNFFRLETQVDILMTLLENGIYLLILCELLGVLDRLGLLCLDGSESNLGKMTKLLSWGMKRQDYSPSFYRSHWSFGCDVGGK